MGRRRLCSHHSTLDRHSSPSWMGEFWEVGRVFFCVETHQTPCRGVGGVGAWVGVLSLAGVLDAGYSILDMLSSLLHECRCNHCGRVGRVGGWVESWREKCWTYESVTVVLTVVGQWSVNVSGHSHLAFR